MECPQHDTPKSLCFWVEIAHLPGKQKLMSFVRFDDWYGFDLDSLDIPEVIKAFKVLLFKDGMPLTIVNDGLFEVPKHYRKTSITLSQIIDSDQLIVSFSDRRMVKLNEFTDDSFKQLRKGMYNSLCKLWQISTINPSIPVESSLVWG